jgi:hypothetical protein
MKTLVSQRINTYLTDEWVVVPPSGGQPPEGGTTNCQARSAQIEPCLRHGSNEHDRLSILSGPEPFAPLRTGFAEAVAKDATRWPDPHPCLSG